MEGNCGVTVLSSLGAFVVVVFGALVVVVFGAFVVVVFGAFVVTSLSLLSPLPKRRLKNPFFLVVGVATVVVVETTSGGGFTNGLISASEYDSEGRDGDCPAEISKNTQKY
jgi:hypothetical protein